MKKKVTLLIVDDDALDRQLFTAAVREVDESIECKEVNNGEQALALLNDDSSVLPDCIFLDLRMPRISGKKCLQEIKKDDRLKHIPVFIYTTSREVEESKTLKEMGAFHFISKPNNEEEIFYLVAFALEELSEISRNDLG
jgi:DNA-binding NtrC family response regulator